MRMAMTRAKAVGRKLAIGLMLVGAGAGFGQGLRPELRAYNVDPAQVTVGGFSSGADMAVQLGVAYSSQIRGVAAFAPAPYDCRRGGGVTDNNCFGDQNPDIALPEANMRRWSGREIDAVANLARQRVYVFRGTGDPSMGPLVVGQAVALYSHFVPAANLYYETSVVAKHVLPTDFFSSRLMTCAITGGPNTASQSGGGLANCGFDGAGASLVWLYGPLVPRAGEQPGGQIVGFDQSRFISRDKGMDEIGFLYVPTACAAGAACRLHVFLHACNAGYYTIGEPFYAEWSGHSRWAETNNIVLLFPQAYPDSVLNPTGCWDTNGIYDEQFDQIGGTQVSAIMAMVRRITSGFVGGPRAVEYHHAEWDHYFVTAEADEIAKLDSGAFAGWARTGESFPVAAVDTAGTDNVCRFFSTAFAPRSSHFYTASASECGNVRRNPDWLFEDLRFALPPDDGEGHCAGGRQPIYRLYNDGHGGAPNHRFTTSAAIREAMIAAGWIPEGNGIGVMGCTY
ncbi:MAG: hypothetical protein U1F10_09045 [Burkholderiales bacterium]